MTTPPITFKRKHHQLLLCADARKVDLLAELIAEHESRRIAVVVSDKDERVYVPDTAVLLFDDALGDDSFDLLISYDLPDDPQQYVARLALAEETALTLMGESDREKLLAIETLLGRALPQDRPAGYSPPLPKEAPRPQRTAKEGQRRPADSPSAPKKAFNPSAKRTPKAGGVSRYIGKDEEGKPGSATGKTPFKGGKKPYAAKQETGATKSKRPVRRIKADQLKKKPEKQ